MFCIHLDERYRADCNELVKLFLPENSYQYVETDLTLTCCEHALWFETRQDGDESFLQGSLSRNGQVMFRDETPILHEKADPHKDLKRR